MAMNASVVSAFKYQLDSNVQVGYEIIPHSGLICMSCAAACVSLRVLYAKRSCRLVYFFTKD